MAILFFAEALVIWAIGLSGCGNTSGADCLSIVYISISLVLLNETLICFSLAAGRVRWERKEFIFWLNHELASIHSPHPAYCLHSGRGWIQRPFVPAYFLVGTSISVSRMVEPGFTNLSPVPIP